LTLSCNGMFDCNDLKRINDEFGHERGDAYLKAACRLICRVFQQAKPKGTSGSVKKK